MLRGAVQELLTVRQSARPQRICLSPHMKNRLPRQSATGGVMRKLAAEAACRCRCFGSGIHDGAEQIGTKPRQSDVGSLCRGKLLTGSFG